MARKKIVTKNRKSMSLDEIKAYKVAYGDKLKVKDFTMYVGSPALIFGGMSLLLLHNFWLSFVLAFLGALYGVTYILPKAVKKQYEARSFVQRNKFLNNISQVLTDEGQTVMSAIGKVTPRADGEFKDDLEQYHAMLIGVDDERLREATIWFSEKYEGDVVFLQYLEQLETAMLEGKSNVDTLKDIKSYHNDIQKKQDYYELVKQGHLSAMKQLMMIATVMIIVMNFSFGYKTYEEAYATHFSGYISAGIYLLVLAYFFRQFMTYYMDDSVMEIRK